MAASPLHAGVEYQVDGLRQREQKARHGRVRNRQGTILRDALLEQRRHAAAAADHVSVPHHQELRRARSASAFRQQYLLGERFCHPHGIDRFDGLIGADRDDHLHLLRQGRAANVFGAGDVGQNRFHRMTLTVRDLLQRSGMVDDVDPPHRLHHGRAVANVADDKAQPVLLAVLVLHVALLLLVAAEDDNPLRPEFKQVVDDLVAEAARSPGHQDSLSAKEVQVCISIGHDKCAPEVSGS